MRCWPKFWRVVVAATILGDTLVELQLLYFGSLLAQGLRLLGVLSHCAGYFGFPTYPMDLHGSYFSNSVKHNQKFSLISVFRIREGQFSSRVEDFRSISFHLGVAPLLEGLDSISVKSYRNTHIAPLPLSLFITLVELHASPLCTGSLSLLSPLYFSRGLCIGTYLFLGRKRDLKLLRVEEVVPLEKHVRPLTQVCSFGFSPSPLLLVK